MKNQKSKAEPRESEAGREKRTKFSATIKNQKLLLLFLIILLGNLLFPLAILAGEYKADDQRICYEGLVPCGLDKPLWKGATFKGGECVGGTPIKTTIGEKQYDGIPCQFCHFFVMFKGILDFVLKLVIVIAVLMLTVGGIMFFFAGASPKAMGRAKKILTSTAIGLAIIFAAWIIVNTVFMFIGVADWTGLREDWFSIKCQIKL